MKGKILLLIKFYLMEEFYWYYLFNFFEESEILCCFGLIFLNRLIMFYC